MTLLNHDESPFSRLGALSAAEEDLKAANHQDRLQWLTWDRTPEDIASPEHQARKAKLALTAGASFAPTAYVAADAAIFTSHLVLGENSWIAGHALVRGDIEFGANSTVNPYACISARSGWRRRAHRFPCLDRRLQSRLR